MAPPKRPSSAAPRKPTDPARPSARAKAPTPPALPAELVAAILKIDDPAQVRFTGKLVDALAKIGPSLVPRLNGHPWVDAIVDGTKALPRLVKLYERTDDESERAAILDAMAEIFHLHGPTAAAVSFVERALSEARSALLASLAAKALARAGHEPFLEQQRAFLRSRLPEQQRIAARLCGLGRYRPAVPELLALLSTEDMAISDAVIEALGEIGSDEALPKLHRMLASFLRTELVIDAIGRIGQGISIVRLLPLLGQGSAAQRERTVVAIGRIVRRSDGRVEPEDVRGAVVDLLARMAREDPSAVCRFHALVVLALLGERLDPRLVAQAVGASLDPDELGALEAFFVPGARPTSRPRGKGRTPV